MTSNSAPAGPTPSGNGKTGTNSPGPGSQSSNGPGPTNNPNPNPTTQPKPPKKGPVPQPKGQCTPTQPKAQNGSNETGITTGSVTIGEILSDVSQLPQQFHPTYEGLSAWADLANHSGGICGRQINIQERNDQAFPQNYQSDYQDMSGQVFAFVATESLQDSAEYSSSPPFEPKDKDSKVLRESPLLGPVPSDLAGLRPVDLTPAESVKGCGVSSLQTLPMPPPEED